MAEYVAGDVKKSGAIYFPTVADLDHPDSQFKILYRIDDAVIPLTNAEPLLSGKFFTAVRPRLKSKSGNPLHDPLQITLGDVVKLFLSGRFKENAINGHLPSALSAQFRKKQAVH